MAPRGATHHAPNRRGSLQARRFQSAPSQGRARMSSIRWFAREGIRAEPGARKNHSLERADSLVCIGEVARFP